MATSIGRAESPSRVWMLILAVLAVLGAAMLAVIGMNLSILYSVVAVAGIMAVIVVVMNPVFGIVCLVGTLVLGLPWFLAGDGRLTANNLLGLVLLAVLIIQVCLSRDLWFIKTPQDIL